MLDGDKAPDPANDLLRIAVIERHGKTAISPLDICKVSD